MFGIAKYKDQYRQNLRLAGPVVLSHAGIVLSQLIDTAMVGRLGTAELGGVSLGITLFMVFFIFCMGITVGLTPLVGEAYATQNHRASAAYLQNALVLYFVVGLVSLAAQLAAIPLLYHLRQPAEIISHAIVYYKYLIWSLVPLMIYFCLKQFLEGVGNTKTAMVAILASDGLKILLNWLLIYGNWGFPAMGVEGAGIAMLISRLAAPLMIAAYFIYKDTVRRYFRLFRADNFSWRNVGRLLGMGTPIASQMLMEYVAFGVATLMMGWIGTAQIGGNKIAMDMSTFAFMMIQGVAAATTIRVSFAYGRRDTAQLRLAANASYHIGIAWNLFTALLFILLRNHIPLIFTSDPQVIRIAAHLLVFAGIFQISDGLQVVTIGILRGLQDVKSIMRIAFVSYIVISMPLSYLCAFVLGFGAGGLWMGLIIGLSTAAVLLIRRLRTHLR